MNFPWTNRGANSRFSNRPNTYHEVKFSNIPKTVPPKKFGNQLSEYHVLEQDFQREPPDIELNFYYSMKLIFQKQYVYSCKKITLQDVGIVEAYGFYLRGAIHVIRSSLVLNDCIFEKPPENAEYFVSLSKSKCSIINSSFSHSHSHAIGVDDYSELVIKDSIIWKCGQSNVMVTSNSKCYAINTTLSECQSNLIYVRGDSEVTFRNCVLKNSVKKGVFSVGSTINLYDCIFSSTNSSGILLDKSENCLISNCIFMNVNSVAFTIEQSTCNIIDTKVENCRKGAIRVLQNSSVDVNNCTFSGSKWSLINLYDESKLVCNNTLIECSTVRAITSSDSSSLLLNSCIIQNCSETGIRVIGTQNVRIYDSIISKCKIGGIDICDNGYAEISNTIFSGGFENGINVYTGGSCTAKDSFIFGPFRHAVSVHHGGFGNFSHICIHNLSYPLKSDAIRLFAGQTRLMQELDKSIPILEVFDVNIESTRIKYYKSFFRIETKWLTTATHCYISDFGNYELIANISKLKNRNNLNEIQIDHMHCMACHKEAKGFHFSPCGHCCYCKECWEALAKKPKRCPLCKVVIEKTSHAVDCSEDGESCPICYDSPMNSIILPCGHLICKDCAYHWLKTSSQCPFCREPNVKVRQIVSYA